MEQQYLDSKSVSEELIGDLDDFRTSHAINEVLGKLFILVAQNRIPLRNASALSYICQLLLTSTPGVRGELQLKGDQEELFVLNRTTDLMWGKDDEEDESGEEEESENTGEKSEEEAAASQSERNKTNFQSHVDAAVKILGG